MRNLLFLISYTILCFGILQAQQYSGQIPMSAVPQPKLHYQDEYTFDSTVDPAKWNSLPAGLQVSFGSTDKLYMRTAVPALEQQSTTWEETGWRGERLNTQLLVWTSDTIRQVRLKLNDLKTETGKMLSKDNMKVNMVRYIVSNYPYGAKEGVTCGVSPHKEVYLMPDRFESFDRFEIPAKTVRPVWISVDIPANTEPGIYSGDMEVLSEKTRSVMHIKLKIQNQILPKPTEWKHRLDLWQNPWVVAWYNNIQPWSEEHMAMLEKHLKLYADAGGKFITTYGVHSPWSDNSYMIEGAMIETIKQKGGNWKFDYKIFDEYVQLAMKVGITDAITLYTVLPWGNRFRYMDEATGNYVYEVWPTGSKEFKSYWFAFLTDLQKHLQQKGWFEKTYIGINENEMKETLAAIKVVKDHPAKWKITYAGNWHQELDTLLDDYCFLYGNESNQQQVKTRAARGATTTYYVCCNPPMPNNFVFSPPIEGRWLGWYTSAYGYDGFLRWAYDAWPADPARDARHEFWPAGDCFLVYPGAASCIRFEKLREGIVDFEKLRIIRDLAAKSTDKTVKSLLKQLDQHMKVFVTERAFDTNKITKDVQKGKDLLDQLSDKLSNNEIALH